MARRSTSLKRLGASRIQVNSRSPAGPREMGIIPMVKCSATLSATAKSFISSSMAARYRPATARTFAATMSTAVPASRSMSWMSMSLAVPSTRELSAWVSAVTTKRRICGLSALTRSSIRRPVTSARSRACTVVSSASEVFFPSSSSTRKTSRKSSRLELKRFTASVSASTKRSTISTISPSDSAGGTKMSLGPGLPVLARPSEGSLRLRERRMPYTEANSTFSSSSRSS